MLRRTKSGFCRYPEKGVLTTTDRILVFRYVDTRSTRDVGQTMGSGRRFVWGTTEERYPFPRNQGSEKCTIEGTTNGQKELNFGGGNLKLHNPLETVVSSGIK